MDAGPDGGVCALAATRALRSIALVGAGVVGPLPACLAAAPGLQALHADLNDLEGDLPPLASTLAYLTLSRARSDIPASKLLATDAPPRGGVTGSLPSSLPSSLVLLDATANSLTGDLPGTLPGGLAELRVGGNALTGELLAAYGAASSLTVLDIGGNPNMTGGLPPSVAAAPKLELLDVAGCGLSGPLPKSWSSSLTTLHLARNGFEGALPASLASLPSLIVLDASSNRLAGALTAFADGVPTVGSRLRSLSLADNAFGGGVPLASLSGMGRIAAFAGVPPPAHPPTAADRAASLAPSHFDVSSNPGLGGAFPAWLVDAVARTGRDGVSVATLGVPLTCPGVPLTLPRAPPPHALSDLTCTPPGGGDAVAIASLVRVTGAATAAGAPHAVAAALVGVLASAGVAAAALILHRRRRSITPSRSFSRFPEPASPSAGACAALRVAGPGDASKVAPRRVGSGGSV